MTGGLYWQSNSRMPELSALAETNYQIEHFPRLAYASLLCNFLGILRQQKRDFVGIVRDIFGTR